MKAAKEKGL